jgi:hypothetical protein
MAAGLSTAHGNNLLDASLGTATITATTTPLKCRLMSANGTAGSNGTEVTGGSYASITVTFAATSLVSTTFTANSNVALNYTVMPAITVVGVELWDSAGTPVRKWFGPLAASKTTNAGDTFSIASGSLTATIANS